MNEELYRINQRSETQKLIRFHLCGITFPDKSYHIHRPSSPVWCIEYVEAGCGTVHMDSDTFSPKAGDSYFLHAGKDHLYYADPDTPWQKRFINVSGRLMDSLAEGYGVAGVAHFPGLDLGEELTSIIAIAKKGDMDSTPELILVMNRILYKMRESMAKKEDPLVAIGAEMKDFLNTQITKKFRISLLCKHMARSESQTIRLFKKCFGITPYTYVLEKKLSFAKKLLIDTSLSVKEIATELCFSDEYYFSGLFKEKTGMTPSQYRRSTLQ